MIIENKFNIKEVVYLITDEDNKKRLITAIKILPDGLVYEASLNEGSNWYFDFELSKDMSFTNKI